MALDTIERVMARRQIEALIREDPVAITLTRTVRLDDGAGGWIKGPEQNLPPQIVTIIPFKRRMADMQVNTEIGDVIDYPYMIIGHHDLDIAKDDTFAWNGEFFKVQAIDIKTEVRTQVHIDYYGGETNG